MRSEGSLSGASIAPQTCMRQVESGPEPTMQSCASAAKLHGGGPILNRGSKAMSNSGVPPPRIFNCSYHVRSLAAETPRLTSGRIIMRPHEVPGFPVFRRRSPAARA